MPDVLVVDIAKRTGRRYYQSFDESWYAPLEVPNIS